MEEKELKKRKAFLEEHIESYQGDLDWYASVVSVKEEYNNQKLEKDVEIHRKEKEIEKIKKRIGKRKRLAIFYSQRS